MSCAPAASLPDDRGMPAEHADIPVDLSVLLERSREPGNRLPPPGASVAVAMSGGVDSAAALVLLTQAGYRCTGVTLRLVPEPEEKSVFEPCCGLEAARDAERVCQRLGVPHRIIRAVEPFDRFIIDWFARDYAEGRTPNPCVRCNRMVKFGLLWKAVRDLGCEWLAMGHYARLDFANSRRLVLSRARFREKDQSYVLAPLTQAQLGRVCFPMGHLTKDEARAVAATVDRRSGSKPESQEICFVPDRNYAALVTRRTGEAPPGPIVDITGRRLGTHLGLVRYTIGQRRGLGIAADRPYYVIAMIPESNTLVVGHEEHTACGQLRTGPPVWGGLPPTDQPFDCRVQLRAHHVPCPARVHPERGALRITLHPPQRGVAPGQWAVCYDDQDRILVSGEILDAPPDILANHPFFRRNQ